MNKLWILFSEGSENYTLVKVFEHIFWERPNIEAVNDYFKLFSHELLGSYREIVGGKRVPLWGTDYWIEEFTKP